jgi:phosphomannomutase
LIASVATANGIRVFLARDFTPAGAVSLYINRKKMIGGFMVSASHNPYKFNGIKYRVYPGHPAGKEVTDEITKLIAKNKIKYLSLKAAKNKGLIKTIGLTNFYHKALGDFVKLDAIKQAKLNILADSMHGVAGRSLENLLDDTSIKVRTIRQEPKVDFGKIYPEPILKNLQITSSYVKEGNYDIAIAFDGDADRIGCLSCQGNYINSSEIASLLIWYLVEYEGAKGKIVKTATCSSLIDRIAGKYNLEVIEKPVGFKNLSKVMKREDVLLAVEESGGIAIKDFMFDRDALLIALLLVKMLAKTGKNISELMNFINEEFGKFVYRRIDVPVKAKQAKTTMDILKELPKKNKIEGKKVKKISTIDGLKYVLNDGSWLALRASGTEPILRIYAESSNSSFTNRLLTYAQTMIKAR